MRTESHTDSVIRNMWHVGCLCIIIFFKVCRGKVKPILGYYHRVGFLPNILVVDRHPDNNMHVNSWQSEFRKYLKCDWDVRTQNVNFILSMSEIGYYTGTTLTSSSNSRN